MSGKYDNLRSEELPKYDAHKIKDLSLQHKTYNQIFSFSFDCFPYLPMEVEPMEIETKNLNPLEDFQAYMSLTGFPPKV